MIDERYQILLQKAAKALERGSDPFETWFLVKNAVTAGECMAMSDAIASILKWFLALPESKQLEVVLYDIDPALAKAVGDTIRLDELIKDLKKM